MVAMRWVGKREEARCEFRGMLAEGFWSSRRGGAFFQLTCVADDETVFVSFLDIVRLGQCLAYVAAPMVPIHYVLFIPIQLVFFPSATGLSSDNHRGFETAGSPRDLLTVRSNDVMCGSRTLSGMMLEKLVDQRR